MFGSCLWGQRVWCIACLAAGEALMQLQLRRKKTRELLPAEEHSRLCEGCIHRTSCDKVLDKSSFWMEEFILAQGPREYHPLW